MLPARRSDEVEGELEPDSFSAQRPQAAYRVAADVEVRVKELEQDLAQANAKMRTMELEVFSARQALRNRRRMRVVSFGGLGALVGVVLGAVILALTNAPQPLVGATIVGFIFGLLGGARWEPPDDNFPKAPPPRTQGHSGL